MEQFLKTIKLRDGTSISIRPLQKQDGPALLSFFAALPKDDRLFLKEDVTNKDVINRWMEELNFDKVIAIVAEKDSAIIGDATLHLSQRGWHKHMAEIRCVVSREFQQKGLGTALMRELVAHAVEKRHEQAQADRPAGEKDGVLRRIAPLRRGARAARPD